MSIDSEYISQTMIQALAMLILVLLADSNSVICTKMAEEFVSLVLSQITIFINVTMSRQQFKALDNTKD
jgi:hypothetical protein